MRVNSESGEKSVGILATILNRSLLSVGRWFESCKLNVSMSKNLKAIVKKIENTILSELIHVMYVLGKKKNKFIKQNKRC